MNNRFSLHKIDNDHNFTFDTEHYSLFKFGHLEHAKKFGKELFKEYIKTNEALLLGGEVYIFPSPYMSIPTASNYLAKFFKIELDAFLFKNNLASSKEGKIHRNQTYTIDYGNLSFEQRKKLIANDTYYIDRNLLENKVCIFIDDIKITGSHEYTIDKILKDYNVNGDFHFIYYAELINFEINPKIENYLNYKKINSLQALMELMVDDNFTLNTRVIKYILGLNENDFSILENVLSVDLKKQIAINAISNDYHLIKEYKTNLNNIYYGYQLTEGTKRKY